MNGGFEIHAQANPMPLIKVKPPVNKHNNALTPPNEYVTSCLVKARPLLLNEQNTSICIVRHGYHSKQTVKTYPMTMGTSPRPPANR